MSKIEHTIHPVTATTLSGQFQASAATATTTGVNCQITGLHCTSLPDPRTKTTTVTPITTGGTGNITDVVVNDSETTVS